MASFILTPKKVNAVHELIDDKLIRAGVKKVMIIDEAGNIITECGHDPAITDPTALAALTAANFGATAQIARLIGEEDFTLLFHKGENSSMYFLRLDEELIMLSIFSDEVSLGLIRCRADELLTPVKNILKGSDNGIN
ncbi:MAG TPA: roadblock/LC7 domain-containing protein [Desulfobacterales bacterium]|uniref:Roadblock/LAMTOR2 domain-containing protein n=1 Tax=hydrothermal vent metagenome TaxID=652676 RepID=A0A3B0UPP4_9ZZZZ|nr:roadblock/LC7 domain-containing protein [Desulfobacterales bacterium]